MCSALSVDIIALFSNSKFHPSLLKFITKHFNPIISAAFCILNLVLKLLLKNIRPIAFFSPRCEYLNGFFLIEIDSSIRLLKSLISSIEIKFFIKFKK